VCFNN